MRKTTAILTFFFAFIAVTALAQAVDTWVTFSPPDKSFSVLFPGEPAHAERQSGHEHINMWSYFVPKQAIYEAATSDFDIHVDDVGQIFKNCLDSFLKSSKENLTSSKRIEFERGPGDELPAMAFTAGNAQIGSKGVIIIEKQRIYMFAGMEVGNTTANTERFLDSLTLHKSQ